MMKTFDYCARGLLVALTLFVGLHVWHFLSPRPIDSYIHGGLIGAEQTETLFTGFATIPVLYFFSDGQLQRFNPTGELQLANNTDGFCYHLYDLALGYPNIAQTIDIAFSSTEGVTLPDPVVLAANVVESRHGGKLSRYQCDALDYAPTEKMRSLRLERFIEILDTNQQWEPHRENAHAILAGLDADLHPARVVEAGKRAAATGGGVPVAAAGIHIPMASLQSAARLPRQSSSAAAFASGSLGSLKLTFSTIALFTRDKNWFFQKNEFYVRQDNAEVTYGTEFYHDFTAQRRLFAPPRVTITLPEPRALAVNRFTLALKTHPAKFDPSHNLEKSKQNVQDEILLDPIERALTQELQRQMDRVEDQALMISKGLVSDQIRALMRAQRSDVEIKFSPRKKGAEENLVTLLGRLENELNSNAQQ